MCKSERVKSEFITGNERHHERGRERKEAILRSERTRQKTHFIKINGRALNVCFIQWNRIEWNRME